MDGNEPGTVREYGLHLEQVDHVGHAVHDLLFGKDLRRRA